jgi:arsenate reductase (glutaredoxin)
LYMANEKLTIWEKPTCTTCRSMVRLLDEHGIEFERVNYIVDPPGRQKLEELIRKMGIQPRELLRKREPEYRDLGLADPARTDDELIDAMVRHPGLMQRPILEQGDRAVLARPVERARELLGDRL